MNQFSVQSNSVSIGASLSLSDIWKRLEGLKPSEGRERGRERGIRAITEQLQWFSGTSIRNSASLGGNIITASPISDLNPVWMATNTKFELVSLKRGKRFISASDFFLGYRKVAMEVDEVLVSVHFEFPSDNEYVESYKQSKRREDDIAIVTCCMSVEFEGENSKKVKNARLAFGGVGPFTKRATLTEKFLMESSQFDRLTFEEAFKLLSKEIFIPQGSPGGKEEYRTTLAVSFFAKFYASIVNSHAGLASDKNFFPEKLLSAPKYSLKQKSQSAGTYNFSPSSAVGVNSSHISSKKHTSGRTLYVDDIPPIKGELYGALVTSSIVCGEVVSIDSSDALKIPSVKGFFTFKDIPGTNKIGDIIQDEELFVEKEVSKLGQMIGIVVAESEKAARKAAAAVKVEYKERKDAILTIEQAIERNSFFPDERKISKGKVEEAFSTAQHVVEGEMRIGGQEHFYFEPHSQLVIPQDQIFTVISSSQNLNKTQAFVAKVLNLPAHSVVAKINVRHSIIL